MSKFILTDEEIKRHRKLKTDRYLISAFKQGYFIEEYSDINDISKYEFVRTLIEGYVVEGITSESMVDAFMELKDCVSDNERYRKALQDIVNVDGHFQDGNWDDGKAYQMVDSIAIQALEETK